VTASRRGRRIAEASGFASSDPTPIATATSELARNVFWYATQGEIIFRLIENGARGGIEIIALDEGPGICDVLAGDGGSDSTSDSLAWASPGIRRLMDEFKIISRVGDGTTVIV